MTVQLVGESIGVKAGGVLSLVTRELHVEALPADVPEHIDVEIGALEVGDVFRLADVPAIEGVTFLDDAHETVIATVSMPRGYAEIEEADLAAAEEAAAEGAPEEEAAETGEPADSSSEE